jgi:hypothetical protein
MGPAANPRRETPAAIMKAFLPLLALAAFPASVGAAAAGLPVDLPPPPRTAPLPDAVLSATAPGQVRVAVTAVTTVRSTLNRSDAGTTLQLAFSGSSALTGMRVTAVRLLRGEDDQGAKLTRPMDGAVPPRFMSGPGPAPSPRLGSLVFRGVSRTAEQIRFLEGEVDVVPLDTRAVTVMVPDFLAQAGRVLDQPGLLEQDLEIIPLTEATAPAHANEYTGPALTDCGCQAVFLVRDPGNVLASLALEDPRGRPVTMQPRARGGRADATLWAMYTLPNGLPEHAALRIELAALDTVRTHRFRLEDVPLP